MTKPASVFLTAEWRHLAMLNYTVDPAVLQPLVPVGTELDEFNNRTFVSMVGFLFLRTRVLGVAVPFHRNFEEVNLRFYVRRKTADGWRRGVVFVKELVPRRAIAWVARKLYGERYAALPMSHHIAEGHGGAMRVSYRWKHSGRENQLSVTTTGQAAPAAACSEQEFITEHYWGYTRRKDGGTDEYHVEHPRWNVAQASDTHFDCDVATLYGPQFVDCLRQPTSAFLADGSPVNVYRAAKLGNA